MSKLVIDDRSKDFLRACEQEGRLVVPEPHKLDLSQGAIVVPCADGDQMEHLTAQVKEMCIVQSAQPRLHKLTTHGGAVILSPEWPDTKPNNTRPQNLVEDIIDAQMMKDISTILLFGHAPCGKVGMCGVTVQESVYHLMQAKRRMKACPGPARTIRCFMQVDWGGGDKQIYFLPVERWTQVQV